MCDISGEGWLDEMREGRVEWTMGMGGFALADLLEYLG